jgi:phytoene/squalene synthetase
MDQRQARWATWTDLRSYCAHSADPVGRMVLGLFGQDNARRGPLSDAICTGLQLANHWQDAAVDYARGRIYVPEDLMRQHGVGTWDFSAGRVGDGFRGLMGDLIARTRALFDEGRPLCDRVGRELRFEMRLTWLGGTSILDRIEAVGGDVFHRRPKHSTLDKLALAWRAWRWTPR